MKNMQITLLRHGEPEFELAGNVRAGELARIAQSYDEAGIRGTPPKDVVKLARGHNIVLCSDLPRSLQSAAALGLTGIYASDPLFREVGVPYFSKGSLRLPVMVWFVVFRSLWLCGFSKNGESLIKARERARIAAQRLASLAAEFDRILLVGHGLINYLIAKELLANNWSGPSRPGSRHWAFGIYHSA